VLTGEDWAQNFQVIENGDTKEYSFEMNDGDKVDLNSFLSYHRYNLFKKLKNEFIMLDLFDNVIHIINAKVPIIKMRHVESGIPIDIS